MYNVLIVDDEPWVAYGIKALIDWESLGYTVIGEAYNGLTALETILEKKPEIVISDIRMPGLNGIELLEQINEKQLDTNVILISGYAEFEYAQKAVRLGAFDYLLKQVDKDKLIDTLLRLKSVLTEKQKAYKGLDLFLDDLFELFEPDNKIKISNFLTNRGIGFVLPHYRFISCLYPQTTLSEAGDGIITSNGIKCIRFRTGQNKISILLNYDECKNPIGLLDFISVNLSGTECIGISSIGVFSTPVAKLYQESDIALFSSFFGQGRQMVDYKTTELAAALTKTILHIEVAIKEQKQEQIYKGLDELCEECKARHMLIDQISTIYNQIVSLILKYYSNSDVINEIEYLNYYQIVRYYSSIEQLFERIKAIFEQQAGEELLISNETAKKIIDHINASFTEDILLGDLSKQFNISLGYLSTLIKKETGITYTDYITNKRMGLAKELLSGSSLSIHEIVERVGYKDYFHFNKLFKKNCGITPSKYRKM
ncbi:two-component system response regulator YesN [Paenibacillus sp. V4I3]|uniref:response regulator transcription factor n=1 Tax=Paenibacillus sp. V4I3 TaxID=3042305 RepID=UPI002785785B|nr:response regulator [Paenibacillus sp. V4I3]MDQ0874531.1 two-component system response regulator YesN [Paenibacillus sp. V4I3]